MDNDLMIMTINPIIVKAGIIEFTDYENLKQQALALAYNIQNVEVTEANIQTSKRMLAAVNKRVKEMEDRRIAIKQEILQPYSDFESRVKDIVNIVKTAENIVRDQLREIDEKERNEKMVAIREIFEMRMKHYDFGGLFGFDDFIKPQHLNKSVSINVVEKDMVEWLEKKDVDLKVIKGLPDADAVLAEYLDTKDISIAISIVNNREEVKRQLSKTINKQLETSFVIELSDEKDFKLVEMFMITNNIKFKVEKVEN